MITWPVTWKRVRECHTVSYDFLNCLCTDSETVTWIMSLRVIIICIKEQNQHRFMPILWYQRGSVAYGKYDIIDSWKSLKDMGSKLILWNNLFVCRSWMSMISNPIEVNFYDTTSHTWYHTQLIIDCQVNCNDHSNVSTDFESSLDRRWLLLRKFFCCCFFHVWHKSTNKITCSIYSNYSIIRLIFQENHGRGCFDI